MKRTFLLTALVWAFFVCPVVAADDVFSIGKNDANYGEFACAGNYNVAAENFPDGTTFQVGTSNSKTTWPFIQPGPSDVWAGRKAHAYTVKFDLPANIGKADAYELLIKGWGHPSSPPTLKIQLNDRIVRLSTNRDAKSDAVLTNPAASTPGTYSVKFPVNAIKPSDNTLTITTLAGAWFIYDYVQFQSRSGRIEAIAISPERGIYKFNTSQGVVPARKVKVDYRGECLDKPAWLEVEYKPENADAQKVRLMLNPDDHFESVEAMLPMSDETCTQPLAIKAVLDIQGRKIKSEETRDYPDEAKSRFHPEGM